MSPGDRDQILHLQLYLAKFAGLSWTETDRMTMADLKVCYEQCKEWQQEIGRARGKRDGQLLQVLLKSLAKMLAAKG